MMIAAMSILKHWRWIGIGILCLALGVQTFRLSSTQSALKNERIKFAMFRADTSRVSAEMEAKQAKNLIRVKTDQEAITENVTHDYQAKLAAARTTADRLREKLHRSTGNNPVPATGETARRIDEAPGEDGFSIDDRLEATEYAIQLDSLISWVEKQAAVEVNGPN